MSQCWSISRKPNFRPNLGLKSPNFGPKLVVQSSIPPIVIKYHWNQLEFDILDKSYESMLIVGKNPILGQIWAKFGPKMALIWAEISVSLLCITISNQISLKGIRMCNFRHIVRVNVEILAKNPILGQIWAYNGQNLGQNFWITHKYHH